MTAPDISLLERGQRVGLAATPYVATLIFGFKPLKEAHEKGTALVTALENRRAQQAGSAHPAVLTKDDVRETLALATATLSDRAVGYALAQEKVDPGLVRALRLTYADVRYGDVDEDLLDVKALLQTITDRIPAQAREDFRIDDEVLQPVTDALTAYGTAADTLTTTQEAAELATLSIPELVKRLRRNLTLQEHLITGQRPKADWADYIGAFTIANRTQEVAPSRRVSSKGPRIIKRFSLHRADATAHRLDDQNYGPLYTVTAENRAAADLHLWMGFRPDEPQPTTAVRIPAGHTRLLKRPDLGEPNARYLFARFDSPTGGETLLVVRRVVE